MQDQEATVCNILEAPGQVVEGLENLLPAAFTLSNHLAVCWDHRDVGRWEHTIGIEKLNYGKQEQLKWVKGPL